MHSVQTIQAPQEYMNPFTDYGFKKLFGEETSKPFLIDFLNSVLEGFIPHIADLTYSKNEHLGGKQIDRNVIFDLYCKAPNGDRFIIELQKVKQTYFKERSLYYSTFAIQEQAHKGKWDFKLDPVYCIGILNFELEDSQPDEFIRHGRILDIKSLKPLINSLNFTFIECSKYNREINEHSSKHDKWLYIFSHLADLNAMPSHLSEPIFEDFFRLANILVLPDNERSVYQQSISYYRDVHNIETQNFEKGKVEGKIEGIAEGEAKGKAEGEYNKSIQIAKTMLQKNMPFDMIIEITQLPLDILKSL